jgi:hypothetical protein
MDVYQRRRLVALSAIAVIFIIVVLLIRSCGGDEEQTPLTPVSGATGLGGAAELSQADYIDQGDALCLEANTALASVDTSDPDQAAADAGQIVAGELEQLQTLTLAPGEPGENKLNNFLAALQDQVVAYDDRATAVQHGDDAAVEGIDGTIDSAAADAKAAAKKFGFHVCGDTSEVGGAGGGGGGGGGGGAATTTETTTPEVTAPPVPTTPTTTTPVAPPSEGGGATTPPTTPPSDGGGTGGGDSGSGGVSP